MKTTLNQLPFLKYIQIEFKNKFINDKTLGNLSVEQFSYILISKFFGPPEEIIKRNSRELIYLYEQGKNSIVIDILFDFKSDEAPKKPNKSKDRYMHESSCATIFINTDNLALLGATYMKLIETLRLFKKSALLLSNEKIANEGFLIPTQSNFSFIPKEVDLTKVPNGVLGKKNIEMYLSGTFFTRNIHRFELLNKQIYICSFENEFICAYKKPHSERYILWVPFIANEYTKEESEEILGKIEKRIKIQTKYIEKGIVYPILRTQKIGKSEINEKPFPKRPTNTSQKIERVQESEKISI